MKIKTFISLWYKYLSLLVFAIFIMACGGVVGAVAALFLQIMHFIIEFLWTTIPNSIPLSLSVGGINLQPYSIVLCAVGGLLIGLWQKKYGNYPNTLDEVVKTYKTTKNIRYDNLHVICIAAILPLIFGGSIGPEAGLAGIIAGLFCWVRDKYKTGIIKMLESHSEKKRTTLRTFINKPLYHIIGTVVTANSQTYTISIIQRWTVYIVASIGGVVSFRLIGKLFSSDGLALARFSQITFGLNELLAFFPLIALGIVCGALFLLCQKLTGIIFAPLEEKKVLRAVICGVVFGTVGMFLPYTMYSGEKQMLDLVKNWQSWTMPMLFVTGFVKILMINLCNSGGWRGGNFFPSLFCATAIGFGLAEIFPVNASFIILTFMAAYTAMALGQPLIVAALCMLFAPLSAIIPIVIAAFIGGKLHFCVKEHKERIQEDGSVVFAKKSK
ncbi:MAG TPA: chloride channel protein [Candidatus Dojkabacteria bacterium]|nr:chloride channel protein [Candidatus Dojkabacteria bacterium]